MLKVDELHLNNPDKGMTIYDLPALIVIAYTNGVTPSKIQACFKSTGIYPFNPNLPKGGPQRTFLF